jgi:hypothetical protein
MKMLIYAFLVTIWLGCGVAAAGKAIAFFSRRYLHMSKTEYIFHMISILGGPMTYIASLLSFRSYSYGWTLQPWRAIKIQRLENTLDGLME